MKNPYIKKGTLPLPLFQLQVIARADPEFGKGDVPGSRYMEQGNPQTLSHVSGLKMLM